MKAPIREADSDMFRCAVTRLLYGTGLFRLMFDADYTLRIRGARRSAQQARELLTELFFVVCVRHVEGSFEPFEDGMDTFVETQHELLRRKFEDQALRDELTLINGLRELFGDKKLSLVVKSGEQEVSLNRDLDLLFTVVPAIRVLEGKSLGNGGDHDGQ